MRQCPDTPACCVTTGFRGPHVGLGGWPGKAAGSAGPMPLGQALCTSAAVYALFRPCWHQCCARQLPHTPALCPCTVACLQSCAYRCAGDGTGGGSSVSWEDAPSCTAQPTGNGTYVSTAAAVDANSMILHVLGRARSKVGGRAPIQTPSLPCLYFAGLHRPHVGLGEQPGVPLLPGAPDEALEAVTRHPPGRHPVMHCRLRQAPATATCMAGVPGCRLPTIQPRNSLPPWPTLQSCAFKDTASSPTTASSPAPAAPVPSPSSSGSSIPTAAAGSPSPSAEPSPSPAPSNASYAAAHSTAASDMTAAAHAAAVASGNASAASSAAAYATAVVSPGSACLDMLRHQHAFHCSRVAVSPRGFKVSPQLLAPSCRPPQPPLLLLAA
jgi:hypothetical protein